MSVRVVARIRPLLKSELEKDIIVHAAAPSQQCAGSTVVSIPNPKNNAETFSFNFNSVYTQSTTQQELFEGEVAPTVKHLFSGFDVTLFAYGTTGAGKTWSMKGGKSLADRGMIPRLLSSIYRRGRKVEKDTEGATKVEVAMSYYEIYNDRVFDLFEPPEKRTLAGLPIRDYNGKTIVAGLTERPCETLRDFEHLYDEANVNRSTSATKLNAHSSRSHAILCVKVSQTTGEHSVISTASAIDLAGSEDNRRTENDRERMVESSNINKSLFVLSQCVEAISKKQSRIPYRESKMTRILSLGQNNGLTIMILNLAPVRSFHLDTLSTLNVANRTKRIEVREIENEPIFKSMVKPSVMLGQSLSGPRQPLRSIPAAANIGLSTADSGKDKPAKTFAVYAERNRLSDPRNKNPLKRQSDALPQSALRVPKALRIGDDIPKTRLAGPGQPRPHMSQAAIEDLIKRTIDERLAAKALAQSPTKPAPPALDAEVQRRLDALESRIEAKEDARSEGLQFLLMAKQHQVRGEDASALRMYRLAVPFFPENEKLQGKMRVLEAKLAGAKFGLSAPPEPELQARSSEDLARRQSDGEFQIDANEGVSSEDEFRPAKQRPRKRKIAVFTEVMPESSQCAGFDADGLLTPRTSHLLRVLNTRNAAEIRSLKGVGAKKAEVIVNVLCDIDGEVGAEDLERLAAEKGVGARGVEVMRKGVTV